MKNILEIVKDEYYDAIWKGSNQGFRNLNHGVCSGLIVLQALTFYHEFIWGLNLLNWTKFNDKQLIENSHINCISKQIFNETNQLVKKKYVPKEMGIRDCFSADIWLKKVLWATASIAIHDLIQEKYYERICKERSNSEAVKIKLDSDPLAFLGVLVDALEEWDRYTVSGESAFSEKTKLLQSTDVDVDVDFDVRLNKIYFYYPPAKDDVGKDYLKDIEKALNRCLFDWNKLVEIGKKDSCPDCGAPLRIFEPSKTDAAKHIYEASCKFKINGNNERLNNCTKKIK